MKFLARPLPLLIALALGSLALGAVTPSQSSTEASAARTAPALPISRGDTSVPPASTVRFPLAEDPAAPTF